MNTAQVNRTIEDADELALAHERHALIGKSGREILERYADLKAKRASLGALYSDMGLLNTYRSQERKAIRTLSNDLDLQLAVIIEKFTEA